MTNKNNKKLGFSLIELSIVILIIGILVAGVTQGSRLVGRSKLTAAKSLTQSSPVTGIKDLSMWLETTSDKSFKSIEASDGTPISAWYDIEDVSNKTNASIATVATTGTAIKYMENSINGLPTVRFNSASDYYFTLNDQGAFLNNNSYSVFYVVRLSASPAAGGTRPILASNTTAIAGGTVNSLAFFNAVTATTFKICESNTAAANCSNTTYPFGTPIPQIISVISADTTNIKSIYLNGNNTVLNSGAAVALPNMTDLTIGKNNTNYFVGDIGEIIVFTRALTNSERQSVECYLGKKWGISGPTCA